LKQRFDAGQWLSDITGDNDAMSSRLFIASCLLIALAIPVSVMAAESLPKREIIPGSELMTAPEREQYRLRLRGAGTTAERERLRAEHVKAMEERARLRGLKLIDYSREPKP
jgi:hypothetical protein